MQYRACPGALGNDDTHRGGKRLTDPDTSDVTAVELSKKTAAAGFSNPFLGTTMETLMAEAKPVLQEAAPRYGLTYSDENFIPAGPMPNNTWDNRTFDRKTIRDENGNYRPVIISEGDYGHEWQITFTLKGVGKMPEIKLGDVNFDGETDVLDAALVQKYASGMADLTEDRLAVGDVNNDNNVDVLDATEIQKFAAGKISEFKKKA